MGLDILAFGLGGLMLLVAFIGGGFELKEVRIPSVGWKPRSAAAIVGILFVSLGIIAHPFQGEAQTVNPAPHNSPGAQIPPGASLKDNADPVEANKQSLISAIRLADDVEARALYNLDASLLNDAYIGEALRREQTIIKALKSDGLYEDAKLEEQVFKSFKVSPDGKKAEVEVVETWSSVDYRIGTQKCVQQTLSSEIPQTVFLVRGRKRY